MLIIDFHTRSQQIVMVNDATGELSERHLGHGTGEATHSTAVWRSRVGIEASGPIHWVRALARGAWSRAMDRRFRPDPREPDAALILDLLLPEFANRKCLLT